ncbi:uncharacterized protein LOC132980715 [Labrus mixtus]|uniref:uncharacterized protein LOC132980715 n=1 Tax=Labrus mixtus TaxID=508554 RepID=UPI0029C0B593|nr:uncharacterized protein LOC132980715 [Labrus mixtus]
MDTFCTGTNKRHLSMSRRPPKRSRDDLKDGSTPSLKRKSELQASLHSYKEKKRRLQIRTSCRRLRDLLPFVGGHLDTATTLELTARYMSYLKETLPPNVLSKVYKAVEEKVSNSWKSKQRPQRKRKKVRLKRITSQRAQPATEKSNEDHDDTVKCTQQKLCNPVNQPPVTKSHPLTVAPMPFPAEVVTSVHAPPILLDKSAVPWGQMLPVCQDQFLSASFQSVENNLMNPTSRAFTSEMISPTFLPELGPDLSSYNVFWDATPDFLHPTALPSVNVCQNYSPPQQATVTHVTKLSAEQSYVGSSLVCQTASVSENRPPTPLSSSSVDVTPEDGNVSVSDVLCHSRLLLESDLCSSSPLTDSPLNTVNQFWLDLLLDTNGNLCLPDASLVNMNLSPYARTG